MAEIGKQRDRGQSMFCKDNQLIRKGNEQISESTENVNDGKAMVKSGEKLVAEAEAVYEADRLLNQGCAAGANVLTRY